MSNEVTVETGAEEEGGRGSSSVRPGTHQRSEEGRRFREQELG